MSEKIKVHVTYDDEKINGESLWATRINKNTAKIDNIPWFTTDFSLGDLVRIDEKNEILDVVEKVANTRQVTYKPAQDRVVQESEWVQIKEYFKGFDIVCESAMAGFFSMSVPVNIKEKELENIVGNCTIDLNLCGEE